MIKKGGLIFALAISLLIFGCSQSTSDLPTPPDLDSSAPIGQAFMAVDGSAYDRYETVCTDSTCVEGGGSIGVDVEMVKGAGQEVVVSLSANTDALYETAYLFSAADDLFYPFDFEGVSSAHPDSDLANGPVYYQRPGEGESITAKFKVNEKNFFEGENILLVFYCNVDGGNYDCNKGRWVANYFKVVVGQPDFTVTSEKTDYQVLVGDSVLLDANVKNLGVPVSGSLVSSWYVEGKEETMTVPVSELPVDYSYTWNAISASPKPYLFSFKVDSNDNVPESNEENNKLNFEVYVSECKPESKRCFTDPNGETLNMVQACDKIGFWDKSKLRASPCNPGEVCNGGACSKLSEEKGIVLPEADYSKAPVLSSTGVSDGGKSLSVKTIIPYSIYDSNTLGEWSLTTLVYQGESVYVSDPVPILKRKYTVGVSGLRTFNSANVNAILHPTGNDPDLSTFSNLTRNLEAVGR